MLSGTYTRRLWKGVAVNNKTFAVAYWEFAEKVKSKAFIISLVLMPIIMVAFGILPTLLAFKEDDKTITVGIVDETGTLVQPLAEKLDQKYKLSSGQPNFAVKNLGSDAGLPTKTEANRMVVDGKVEGYFFIPKAVYDSG